MLSKHKMLFFLLVKKYKIWGKGAKFIAGRKNVGRGHNPALQPYFYILHLS